MYYLSREDFISLLRSLEKSYNVYAPVKKNNQRFYKKFAGDYSDILVGEVRPFEPLKAFFSPGRESVAEGFKPDVRLGEDKPSCVVGVKACDLKGFKVQDYVFLNHDYEDPFYSGRRKANLIISSDCTCAIDTCFCLALGVKPYPQEDFDINLSPVEGGFVVELGSSKGREVFNQHSHLFRKADEDSICVREEQRKRIIKEVDENIKDNNIPLQDELEGVVEEEGETDIWEDEVKTCVECGACNTICPTCHCFLLYDEKDEDKMQRLRIWDSCLVKDFARVAGGANPRPKLWMRLRNRFVKKFNFFPRVADIYACTGCGRCILACPAKIDIREVLRRLVDKKRIKE
ncbi:MAG: hypothetical protein GF375_06255 [Candidatus Omnitrophica bacterium]|nr:hypothetical protein [Candidatus Omnitrophota bacterium]MBD3269578.1 hypothetical protein [Candidatus Omnitrophota bacterium]